MKISKRSPASLFSGPHEVELLLEKGYLDGTYGIWWDSDNERFRGWFITSPDQNPIAVIGCPEEGRQAIRVAFSSAENMKSFIEERSVQIFGSSSLEFVLRYWPFPRTKLPTDEIEKHLVGLGFSLRWDKLCQHKRSVWLHDPEGDVAKLTYNHYESHCKLEYLPTREDIPAFDRIADELMRKFDITEFSIAQIQT